MERHKQSVELLIFDKDNIPQYANGCKLKINRITSQLCVEYFVEKEVKLNLKAPFKWKLILKKNLIFVFDPAELQNFVLIFKHRTLSKTVYSAIYKNKVKDFIEPEILQARIILPIIKKITENTIDKEKLIRILSKWINFYQNEEKQVYLNLLKENNVYEIFYPITDLNRKKQNKLCKRRYRDIEDNSDMDEKVISSKNNYSNICIDFKFGVTKQNSIMVKTLVVFTSIEKSHCYAYQWSIKRQNYYCIQCRTKAAIIDVDDETNNLCVMLEADTHLCPEVPYDPSKLIEGKLLQKPSYEILERIDRKTGKALIIFKSDDRSQCHEFRWRKQARHFHCDRCRMTVKIYNENLKNEYLELKTAAPHDCPLVPYDKEKYYQFQNFVHPGDFEIKTETKKEKEKKWLIIQANEKKTKFYKYVYYNNRNIFYCYPCRLEKKEISARLCQNEDGEEYVILSKRSHICTPYTKENDNQILRHPGFKVMETTASGLPKLFIFTSKSQNLCYTFTSAFRRKNILGRFTCLGCETNVVKSGDQGASVYLHEDHYGQHYVKLSDRKHICKPRKYEPEKYEIKEKIYDFIFCSPKSIPSKMYAVIMHPEKKKSCYKLLYQKEKNVFLCYPCQSNGKQTIIKLQKDENGKEFFYYKQHICDPIKYSSIQAPKYKILSSAEKEKRFQVKDKSKTEKKMPKNVDESKIIRSPNFQLQHCKKTNNKNGRLIIYASEDKKQKYDLYFCKYSNGYRCSKCEQKKLKVNAKLHIDENGESIVILGKHDHICEPIKEDENKNFHFELRNGSKGAPNKKLIVFTSEKKEFYRDYFWVKKNIHENVNLFQCCGCGRKSYVFVKLVEDENGPKYVDECGKNQHVCEPKKYDPEQGNPLKLKENEKLIPSECFEFHKIKNGEADKRLFIFTSEKKEYFYAYRFCNPQEGSTQQHSISSYNCDGCGSLNRHIIVTVIDDKENQRKYVKVNSAIEHVCQPRKYDSEKYSKIDEEPKIISKEGYEIHEYQKLTGGASKLLVVFASDKRNYVYEYKKSGCKNSYVCSKCAHKKTPVRANISQKDGEECLILGENEHVCNPIKYDPKKYSKLKQKSKIIPKEMFELHKNLNGEENKRLIVFTSAKKDLMYEYVCEYKNSYRCGGCRSKNALKAKVIKDENDEVTAVELLPGEHPCIPKKYDPIKYSMIDNTESRIFSNDRFKLEKNSKGQENKKLIFFTSDKRDYVYEFIWCKGNTFKCDKCATRNKYVGASLFEDSNGKQCVKFGQNDHLCKPKKYVEKK